MQQCNRCTHAPRRCGLPQGEQTGSLGAEREAEVLQLLTPAQHQQRVPLLPAAQPRTRPAAAGGHAQRVGGGQRVQVGVAVAQWKRRKGGALARSHALSAQIDVA